MTFNNLKPESLRLSGYDYSSDGAYFITICSYERKCVFGKIANNEFYENALGKLVREELLATTQIRKIFSVESWVIMPNHLHAIICINNENENIHPLQLSASTLVLNQRNSFKTQTQNLSSFVRGYKSAVSSKAKSLGITNVWQANFFERIIRNQQEYENIENYIAENISKWSTDENYRIA